MDTDTGSQHNDNEAGDTGDGSGTAARNDNEESNNPMTTPKQKYRRLQAALVTRWHSDLAMFSSVLCCFEATNETLKKIGRSDLCLDQKDKNLLTDIQNLFIPFLRFTQIFSTNASAASLIPLVSLAIKQMCSGVRSDSATIRTLKRLTLQVSTKATQHKD